MMPNALRNLPGMYPPFILPYIIFLIGLETHYRCRERDGLLPGSSFGNDLPSSRRHRLHVSSFGIEQEGANPSGQAQAVPPSFVSKQD